MPRLDDSTTMSGAVFSRVLRAGALAVVREQETLDRINVFPVRDADTGANLAATLKAAASRLGSAAPDAVGAAARVAADGALDGARGNSGAIFAQFLHGLASSMERLRQVDGPQFAAAAVRGTESAYSALQDPGRAPSSRCSRRGRTSSAAARTKKTCPSSCTAVSWRPAKRLPPRPGSSRCSGATTSSTPAVKGSSSSSRA